MKLLQGLIGRGGYVNEKELNQMIELFGEDFKVVVKGVTRNRWVVKLKDLETFEDKINESILEVFMTSSDFERLETVVTEGYFSEKEIGDYVSAYQNI